MRSFFLVIFTLSFLFKSGQQVNISEKLKTWNDVSLPDSVRLSALFFVSNAHLQKGSDSTLYYAHLQSDYAKTRGIKKPASSALNILGAYHYNKMNYDTAIKYYNEAYEIRAQMNDKVFMGVVLANLGQVHEGKNDFYTAIDFYTRALELRKLSNIPQHLENNYSRLGLVYIHLEDLEKAESCYLKALSIAEKTKNERGAMNDLNNLGTVYLKQGNFIGAMDCAFKSLKIKTKYGDSTGIASSYFNIGSLYSAQGDHNKAKSYFEKALAIYRTQETSRGLIMSLNHLAKMYSDEKNFEKAMQLYSETLGHLEKFNFEEGKAVTLSFVAMSYKSQADLAMKQRNLEKSGTMLDLSFSYYSKVVDLAVAIHDKRDLSNVTTEIADVYFCKSIIQKLKKNPDSAGYYFKKSIAANSVAYDIAKEISSTTLLRSAAREFWWLYTYADSLDKAKKYADESLLSNQKTLSHNFSSFTEFEKEKFLAKISNDYDAFFTLMLRQNKLGKPGSEEVYNYALKNKGLLLKSSTALRNIILNGKDTSLMAKYNYWTRLKKQLAENDNHGSSSAKLEAKTDSVEKEIVKLSAVFNDYKKLNNITWKDVQRKTNKSSAAIEFVRFNKDIFNWADTSQRFIYCALVLTADCKRPHLVELFEEKQLVELLGGKVETDELYVTGIYGDKMNINPKLYELIWKPLEKYLNGVKTVYYSPAGLLHKISFASIGIKKETYLCDKYRLELQGSTAKLALPEKSEFNNKSSISIFGDIQYDTPVSLKDTMRLLSWPYLEGTKTESEKVNRILSSGIRKTNYVNGLNATEDQFKLLAPESNIAHIATHGFFFSDPEAYTYVGKQDTGQKETQIYHGGNRAIGVHNFLVNKNPLMRSGLVFAGANEVWVREENAGKEDGVLTAQEVSNMDLRKTNLVVLSACETGLGDIKGTEGVYGLQRSLKMAGVKYIIMSLWQVPDAETAEFMEKFYTKLILTGNIKISFYESQKEMRKKYDPFYWAAFVLLE